MIKRFFILFLIPGMALAEGWSGEGELGFTTTSGNTDSESLNTKLGVSKSHGKWAHKASLEALKASTNNVTSADSMVLREKSQYNFAEKSYGFGKLRYEDDKFSGFDYQAALTFGFGSRFIQNDTHVLDMSLGLGYRSSKNTATQETNGEGVVSADASYEYKISATASFSEAISIEAGDDNTHSESETVLKTRINGNLASKIGYLVKHNSDVPVGVEKTDKILSVSLVYSF